MRKSILLFTSFLLCLFSLSANANSIGETADTNDIERRMTSYEMSVEDEKLSNNNLILYDRYDKTSHYLSQNQKCPLLPKITVIAKNVNEVNWEKVGILEPTACIIEIYVMENINR